MRTIQLKIDKITSADLNPLFEDFRDIKNISFKIGAFPFKKMRVFEEYIIPITFTILQNDILLLIEIFSHYIWGLIKKRLNRPLIINNVKIEAKNEAEVKVQITNIINQQK